MSRSGLRRALQWLALLMLAALAGFGFWATRVMAPMPQALAAMQSGDGVRVDAMRWLVFRPETATPSIGLVLYPGAKVDPRAYAPAARALAASGYLVVIVPMPLNLAVFAPNRAAHVQDAFPGIQRWAVGGHSLGGAMAAQYAAAHPVRTQGLLLWAAYPAGSNHLGDASLSVASIFGTRDGLVSAAEIEASRARLPASTQWTAIEGGNHAQFGWYGPQRRDLPASIRREDQQQQVIEASRALLDQIASVP